MEGPVFSIIVPVFNSAGTIGRTLQSIFDQKYSDFELVVIDGGSTDGSLEIVNSFKNRIVHIISEPDNGVYDAVNKGLNLAKGNWIYILGADDAFASHDILLKVNQEFSGTQKVIFGDVENLNVTHKKVPQLHQSSFNQSLIWRNRLHQQSAFYHKSLFDHFRFNAHYKVLADYDFHLLLLQKKTEVKRIDLTIALCEASGLSKNFGFPLYKEEMKMKGNRLTFPVSMAAQIFSVMKFFYKKFTSIG
jgi:putative colanic acid biosynthesis glycosyltransferase